jgi:pimeloyl-ACP methyl ester carboxylesterase/dienelactone hydrolase
MTAFILVSDLYTGGWVWEEVAAGLRRAGAEAHPVTLTGMGERRAEAGPDTDLHTHVEDVLRVLDGVEAQQVVLVGNGYGIAPLLGAADRRPGRVCRLVHLDAGLHRSGQAALALVTDPAVRAQLQEAGGRDRWLTPPPEGGWHRCGSTHGVPAGALADLARRAAPQPARTLTQPLHLSAATASLPTTGVLCTASGTDLALLETVVRTGDPALRVLTEERVRFLELDAGHWPMLSCPDAVTDALLRAAAAQGTRLTGASDAPSPAARTFLLDPPACPRERAGRIDLYLPEAEGPHPAVVLVHGGPVAADADPTPRDWPTFIGYGRLLASRGVIGVTLDHRLHSLTDFPRAAQDVAEAVARVRADPRVDADHVGLWFFSGGGLLAAPWLAAPEPWLRCLALTYPVLAPLPDWGLDPAGLSAARALPGAGALPLVLTRVERESPAIAATVAEFTAAATDCGSHLEVIDVPGARHAFETRDHTPHTRTAVHHALDAVTARLTR